MRQQCRRHQHTRSHENRAPSARRRPAPHPTRTRSSAPVRSQTLQFQTVQHKITTCDPHPTRDGGIVVLVTGDLAVDGAVTTPLKFAQTFILRESAPGVNDWKIANDIFRLNIG